MDCKVAEEKPLTLDEAIAHVEEHINDTQCGQQRRQLADWLKELRAMKQAPVANVAAWREALEYVLRFDASEDAAMDDGLTDGERISELADHIEECQKKVNSALSKPVRNCDLFGGDKYKLHSLWWNWTGTKDGQNEDGTVKLTFGEWLLEESDKECSKATIPSIELVKSDNEHLRKAINHIVYYVGERVANRMTNSDFTGAVQNEIASAKGRISCQFI